MNTNRRVFLAGLATTTWAGVLGRVRRRAATRFVAAHLGHRHGDGSARHVVSRAGPPIALLIGPDGDATWGSPARTALGARGRAHVPRRG